jgi:hypothetical protein
MWQVCLIELPLLRQAMLSGFLSIWHVFLSMDFILWMRVSVIWFLQNSPISSRCSEGNLKHVVLDEASDNWQCLPYATFRSSITIPFNNLRVCISSWLVFVWWTWVKGWGSSLIEIEDNYYVNFAYQCIYEAKLFCFVLSHWDLPTHKPPCFMPCSWYLWKALNE